MNVEVLLSAMNLQNMDIAEKSNIHSDCIIINQCDKIGCCSEKKEYGIVRMIYTTERGLSKSRNMALANSKADICVLCDDDVIYVNNYDVIIKNAFKEIPDADLIVFNINSINTDVREQETYFKKIRRIPWYKMYSSVHIAFKRNSIVNNNLKFDERFGAGSGIYSMAEDSLFFAKVHQCGLKAYVYPAVIADLYTDKSSWFLGYNQKYFFDVGAFLQAAFPKLKYILSFYYPVRLRKQTKLRTLDCLRWIWKGIKGYNAGMSFFEFIGDNDEGEKQ